jgi:uncharacterized protein YdiU (UPF0061 family)
MPTETTEGLLEFDNSFARELPGLYVDWEPTTVREPTILVLNEELALELRLNPSALEQPEGVAWLAGNATPPGATPIAMAYAGHQFGGYSPRLGDGRALLLGEVIDTHGRRRDIHLKGSGRTPFARGGDGKAAVGPMLREYLIAEAMHALHVPTTRALAVASTGEQVAREELQPGAVLTRVAASHIRVGTFEYAAHHEDATLLRRLADYSIARHHPAAAQTDQPYLALLEAVVEAQASLLARWMLIGFIHGVMNTDNMTISGEGIDYGPCAFMDNYDPATVFSSIDHMGRYAYGNQPNIAQWNLMRFAQTLLPLINTDVEAAVAAANAALGRFPDSFEGSWLSGMRGKLGMSAETSDDRELIDDLLRLLQSQRVDYTKSFRALAHTLRGDDEPLRSLFEDQAALDGWSTRWRARVDAEDREPLEAAKEIDSVNPLYIPRNHLTEEALRAASDGDLNSFHELLNLVTQPFVEQLGSERYTEPASESQNKNFQTYCGT